MTTVQLNTATRRVEVFSSARDLQARADIADLQASKQNQAPALDALSNSTAFFVTLSNDPDPASARATLGVIPHFEPESFGNGVGEGDAAADTAAWQAMLTEAATRHVPIRPRAKRYYLNDDIDLPDGVDIEGAAGNGTVLDFTSKADWANGVGDGLLKCEGSLEDTGRALSATARPFKQTPITSITRSGTTATATTSVDHGLSSGEYVWITGAQVSTSADQLVFYTMTTASSRSYTTPVAITVTGSDTFTYTVEDTGDTSLAGTAYVENGTALDIGDTTGLDAGDLIWLRSEAARTGGSKIGELAYVKHVIDANVLVLRGPVRDTYLVVDTATVFKVTAKKNIRLRNFQLVGKGPNVDEVGGVYGDRGIFLEWVDGYQISGVTFHDVDQMNTLVWGGINGTVEGCNSFFDASDEAGRTSGNLHIQYGHAYGAGSQALTYTANRVYGGRHGIVESTSSTRYGVSRAVTIHANHFFGTWLAAISTHQNSDSLIVTDNYAQGCESGVDLRYSDDCEVTGNTFLDCIRFGVHLKNRIGKATVSRNRVTAGLYGVRIDGADSASDFLGKLNVEDNDIEVADNGIYIVERAAGLLVEDVHVNRNRCRDIGTVPYTIQIGDDAASADGWRGSFVGNSADNYGLSTSSSGAQLANPKFVRILDNGFRVGSGTSAAAVRVEGAGAESCRIEGITNEGATDDLVIAAGLGGHATGAAADIDYTPSGELTATTVQDAIDELEADIAPKSEIHTISSDAITLASRSSPLLVTLNTEGSAATDDLSTISGGFVGQVIVLRTVASSRDVTVKDSVGNLHLDGSVDFTLDGSRDTLALVKHHDTDGWVELSRADNN